MNCNHSRYSDGHCAEMVCPNYVNKCPRHAPSGDLKVDCNLVYMEIDKNFVAKAMGIRIFDTALPQNWVDDVSKATGAKDVWRHFIWCYDVLTEEGLKQSVFGFPVAVSARGARILDQYMSWWRR